MMREREEVRRMARRLEEMVRVEPDPELAREFATGAEVLRWVLGESDAWKQHVDACEHEWVQEVLERR